MVNISWSSAPWIRFLLVVSLWTLTACPDGGGGDDDDSSETPPPTAPETPGDDDDATSGDDDDTTSGDGDDDDATSGDDDDTTSGDDDDATSGDDDDATSGDDDDATSGDDDDATSGDDDDATSGDDDDATSGDDDDATSGDDDDATSGDDDDATSSGPIDGDGDGDGYTTADGDCDDSDPEVHPDAAEQCNSIDDDCDNQIDEEGGTAWYPDSDADGYGTTIGAILACTAPEGHAAQGGDCNDADPATSPGSLERCDNRDNDCDGQIDETGELIYHPDADEDGYGDPVGTAQACTPPAGHVDDGTDCDDTDPSTHPGAGDIPGDGEDQDCDGQDLPIVDLNLDGYPDVVVASFRKGSNQSYSHSTDSLVYWGAKGGPSPAGKTTYPTLAGNSSCIADLDGDGFQDLVFANYRGPSGIGISNPYAVNSYIYWGQAGGPVASRRTELPTMGATECAVGDVNGDGHLDLAFSGYNSATTYTGVTYLYYGAATGFSVDRRVSFESKGNYAVAIADVDADGFDDLFQMNQYAEEGGYIQNSYIYRGAAEGLSSARRTALPTLGPAYDPVVADFNKDGYQDVAISSYYDNTSYNVEAYVYWGSRDGLTTTTRLPVSAGTAVRAADLDRDGWLDLVFGSNLVGSGARSYLYWGSRDGFSPADYTLIPTSDVHDLIILDLDRDGWQDLVFAQRQSQSSSSYTYRTSSYIYLNGPTGFQLEKRFAIPTNGALDAAAADMDLDGFADVLFSGYNNDSTYDTEGYLYYGSAAGYSTGDRLALPMSGGYTVEVVGFPD